MVKSSKSFWVIWLQRNLKWRLGPQLVIVTQFGVIYRRWNFRNEWMSIKQANKVKLANLIAEKCGIQVDPTALFDVQVKRIHEYNVNSWTFYSNLPLLELEIHVTRTIGQCCPMCCYFGGKAAPGYYIAKLVIKLINNVSFSCEFDSKHHNSWRLSSFPITMSVMQKSSSLLVI